VYAERREKGAVVIRTGGPRRCWSVRRRRGSSTIKSPVYPEQPGARGLGFERPVEVERVEIHRIILEELVASIFLPSSASYIQRVIERLAGRGCDSVALGCTEIPLIINDANSPLPTLDSTRLPARAALRRAMQQDKGPP